MLDAFDGTGDFNGNGVVSVNELSLYVIEEVKRLTNDQQTPVLRKVSIFLKPSLTLGRQPVFL